MKKTYNINISGMGFVIDEDAYEVLDSYLKTLVQACESAGQRETAADIEQRIAEIFSERGFAGGTRFLSRRDVEEVIARMGAPEEIVDFEFEESAGPKQTRQGPPLFGRDAQTPPSGRGFMQKRLYRDIDHKVLGGVCSGLAWYLGIDVVWVRIIMVILAFISGSTMVVIYIVLWIVIPPARSPYERMQMMGVDPSVRNVGRAVTGGYSGYAPNGASYSGNASACGQNFWEVVRMILIILGLLVVGGLLVAFSLGFIGCLIAVCVTPGWLDSAREAKLIMGCVMGGTLVAGLPLFLAFRWLIAALTNARYPRLTPLQRTFIVIPWLMGLGACIVCGILL